MLGLLRRRDFALLWFGGLVSTLGDWALLAALPVYVYQLTGSTLATGGMFAALMAPRLLLGSIAGVFVDRWDRRRTLVVANALLAVNVVLLIFVTTADRLWAVFVVAAVQSSLAQLVQPAEGALLPRLVPADALVRANALNALKNDLARLVGPAVGGLVVGYVGLTGVALLDSASFIMAAALVALISVDVGVRGGTPAAEGDAVPAGIWHQWRDGLRLVARSRTLAVIFAFLAITGIGEGFMAALFAPFVIDVLGGGDPAFGWFLSAQAVGGLVGSAVVARWGATARPARLLGFGALGMGSIDLMIFNSPAVLPGLVLPLLLMVVVGLPIAGLSIGRTTLVQAAAEDEYRGRVLGALSTTAALSSLVGTVLGGLLGDRVGIVTLLNVDGIAYCLAGSMVLVTLRSAPVAERVRPA